MRCVLLLFILFSAPAFSQCKTYVLDAKHDTLNCTDYQNLKQGKWNIHAEALRGEPGYSEEGYYADGNKEGVWARYNLIGDVIAIENYKWGERNGISEYYTMEGLLRKESWKVIDPKSIYDTVDVYSLNNGDKIKQRLMKAETFSVRQGTWEYYNPSTSGIIKTEEYFMDELIDPRKKIKPADAGNANSDSLAVAKTDSTLTVQKPLEVLKYEKKNSKKKKIKVREGHTGID